MSAGYFRVLARELAAPVVVLQILRDCSCWCYIVYKIRKRLPRNEQTAITEIKAKVDLRAFYKLTTTRS